MVVQAGAARRSVAGNPDQATAALTQIESTGRQALAEMRRLLGLLRDGQDGTAALTPQPSLAHLDSLLAAAREVGLPVELTVVGEARQLPAGIDVQVWDDGRGANGRAEGDGHGLIGMRERVALFGGSLEVGPQPGGGFLVAAHLPLDGGEPR
jgi:signal transduction histidine kinase